MRILVTGATGFLGMRLALRLQQMGHDVTGIGRDRSKGQALEGAGIRFREADLADEQAMLAACAGQDLVFHSGALSSPWGRYEAFYAANVLGTRHVAEGCIRQGVGRLVHVSTPSLYFDYRHRLSVSEGEPLPARPVNHYAATKLLAEGEVDRAHGRGLPVITIRPRAIFGPGDQAILPRLIRANRRGRVPLVDGGRAMIDVTYVENVVDALLLCMKAPVGALGRKYNITNGEPMELRQLLHLLFTQLDEPLHSVSLPWQVAYGIAGAMELAARLGGGEREPMLTRYSVGVLARSQTLDISAAREELGYQPRVSIAEGLEEFVRWWREVGA